MPKQSSRAKKGHDRLLYGGKKNHQGKYFTKVPLSVFGGLNAFHIACVHAGKNPIWASQSRQL